MGTRLPWEPDWIIESLSDSTIYMAYYTVIKGLNDLKPKPEQLNETFWLGVGTAGSVAPAESVPYSPGPEWRKKWSTHNPNQANEFLDKLGLTKKDNPNADLRDDPGAVEEDRDRGGRERGGAEPLLHPNHQ